MAGTVVSSAIRDARQRRSPAMSSKSDPLGRTRDLLHASGRDAKLGKGQFAGGNPFGKALALALIGHLHQFVGVADGVPPRGDQLPDLRRSIGQPKPIFDVSLVLPDLDRQLADGIAQGHHPAVHGRFLKR